MHYKCTYCLFTFYGRVQNVLGDVKVVGLNPASASMLLALLGMLLFTRCVIRKEQIVTQRYKLGQLAASYIKG